MASNYFDELNRSAAGIQELEKDAVAYPYSPVNNFLLLRHYKKNGHEHYEKFSRKTALYFNNNHWLQFQLSQIKNDTIGSDFNNEKIVSREDSMQPDHFAVTVPAHTINQSIPEIVPANETSIQFNDTDNLSQNFVSKDSKQPIKENFDQQIKTTDADDQSFEPIAFEPLHTIDYFASQGIKIPEEALTNDKLGTQMKSFTEWLKSMKRLQPGKLAEQNSLSENIVQSAAELSNIDTEVLTEAMAEVLIKQNKKEKAIEMYNKLSLINPSKIAYFAAKIDRIKSL